MRVALWVPAGEGESTGLYGRHLAAALEARGCRVCFLDAKPGGPREPVRNALRQAELLHVVHDYHLWGGLWRGSPPAGVPWGRLPVVVTAASPLSAADLLQVLFEERPRQALARSLLARLPRFRARVERAPFARADAVIAHHAAARELLQRRLGRRGRVHLIPPGTPPTVPVTAAEGVPGARSVVAEWGPGADAGLNALMTAIRNLPPGVRLRLLHPPGSEAAVEAAVRMAGAAERCDLVPAKSGELLTAAVASADLVVAPHVTSEAPYLALLGLGTGKPVLAAALPGYRDLAERLGAVDLATPGDDRAFAHRIGFLLASAGTRRRLVEAGRALAQEQTWDRAADATLALYEQVAAARR
jgi:glycosyltransferase involved in cell wall biosynthesis